MVDAKDEPSIVSINPYYYISIGGLSYFGHSVSQFLIQLCFL